MNRMTSIRRPLTRVAILLLLSTGLGSGAAACCDDAPSSPRILAMDCCEEPLDLRCPECPANTVRLLRAPAAGNAGHGFAAVDSNGRVPTAALAVSRGPTATERPRSAGPPRGRLHDQLLI
jgi:hypothetical protein